jgi:hypothetical protein
LAVEDAVAGFVLTASVLEATVSGFVPFTDFNKSVSGSAVAVVVLSSVVTGAGSVIGTG